MNICIKKFDSIKIMHHTIINCFYLRLQVLVFIISTAVKKSYLTETC